MVIERIPKLNIRPKHLIRVYSWNYAAPIPLLRTQEDVSRAISNLSALFNNATPIGTIQSITITSSRPVNFYRCLNYEHLGKIRETYPGLPNHTARVEAVAFYTSHLLNAFKATKQGDVFAKGASPDDSIDPTFNIYNQIAPLIIKVDMLEPEDTVSSIVLWDCWFKQSTITFEVKDADLAIVQEADITFAYPIAY